jgi:hypothetical protein
MILPFTVETPVGVEQRSLHPLCHTCKYGPYDSIAAEQLARKVRVTLKSR